MQIGVLGILTIIFVIAKITGYIAWSWWLVLLPLYGGLALVLLVMGFALAMAAIASGFGRKRR